MKIRKNFNNLVRQTLNTDYKRVSNLLKQFAPDSDYAFRHFSKAICETRDLPRRLFNIFSAKRIRLKVISDKRRKLHFRCI